MNSLHIDRLRVCRLVARCLFVTAALATVIPAARGEVLGNWDFYGGSLAALTGPATLSELSTKPFNDNQDEVGEVFVAHLQFRDEPLSASAIESLGGVTGQPISVPEPASLGVAEPLPISRVAAGRLKELLDGR